MLTAEERIKIEQAEAFVAEKTEQLNKVQAEIKKAIKERELAIEKEEQLAQEEENIANELRDWQDSSAGQEYIELAKQAESEEKRTKFISACFTPTAWRDFTDINQILNIKNNAALNMLVGRYILENKALLEEQ